MAVRPSLNQRPPPKPVEPVAAPQLAPEPVRKERSTVEGYRPPSRRGKRAAVAWLEPEAVKQLNIYAIQHNRIVQDILTEAINNWFAQHGLPRFDEERDPSR